MGAPPPPRLPADPSSPPHSTSVQISHAPPTPGPLLCPPSLCSRNSSPGSRCCPCWAWLWRARCPPVLTAQRSPSWAHLDTVLGSRYQMGSCHLMDRSPSAAGRCPLPPARWTDCTHLPTRLAPPPPFQAPAPTRHLWTDCCPLLIWTHLGGTCAAPAHGHSAGPFPSLLLETPCLSFRLVDQFVLLSQFTAVSLMCVPLFHTVIFVLYPAGLLYLYKAFSLL